MIRLLVALTLLLAARPAIGDPAKLEERWYVVQMQGQRAGWMRESVEQDGDQIFSQSEMKLTIKRGEMGISIRVQSKFVETEAGKPVSMSSTMQLGALPTSTEYRFEEDGVRVFKATGKAAPKEDGKLPRPAGEWLTPRAAERYMADRIAAGDTKISLKSLDASFGLKVISTTHELMERTTLEVVGKTVPALKWTSSTDIQPDLRSTDFTDARGSALRTETDIGGFKLTVILADKDLALAQAEPPEILVSTLIKPDHPVPNPRKLRRAVYRIESRGDRLPDIPTTGAQRFDRIDDRSARITVDLDAVIEAPAADIANKEFTDCSTMITCDDPSVRKLANSVIDRAKSAKSETPAQFAEDLRSFVYSYISKKSLGVGFASAAEVADTRTGDCSEHGVLLAALLRVAGIPSRVVSGIVYVDGFAGEQTVFGYHMWAQALLEVDGKKRWIDVDAALSKTEGFDATHIALAPTSLSEGETTNSLVKLAPLIGTLSIFVEEPK